MKSPTIAATAMLASVAWLLDRVWAAPVNWDGAPAMGLVDDGCMAIVPTPVLAADPELPVAMGGLAAGWTLEGLIPELSELEPEPEPDP